MTVQPWCRDTTVFLAVNMHTKFEACSFSHFTDIEVPKFKKKRMDRTVPHCTVVNINNNWK